MRKRPLCVAVLIMICILWLLPSGIWMKDPFPEGRTAPEILTGEICRVEAKENGQTVYLKHSNLSDTGIILVYLDAEQTFFIGNTLSIRQPYKLQKPELPGNPGQFDAQLYYQTQKIVLFCYAREAEVTDGSVFWPGQILHLIRNRLGKQCQLILGEQQGALLKAMLLGDKSALSEETKDRYQKSGMSHLLAISGLHISVLGMSLYRLLRKTGVSYWLSGVPSMLLIFLYGILTGMGTSTERAVIMCLLAVFADILGRSYDMLTALAVSALLLLLEQPLQARSASFLLSFGAVLGIGLLYPALTELYPVRTRRVQALMVSLSIQLFTLPLIQYFYYEIPICSLFLNLLVIPLMSLLLPAGIISLAVSFLSLRAAWTPILVCRVIFQLFDWLGQVTLRLPDSVWICGKPEPWQMAVYYLGMTGFVFWKSRKRRPRTFCCLYFLILIGCLFLRFHNGLTFTMLDVGQGDSLFLRTASGTTCLIDGGSSSVRDVGRYRIVPFLKSQGVRQLDYVFVTHMDGDHVSGIRELLEMAGEPGSVRIGMLVISGKTLEGEKGKELKELADERGIVVQTFSAGMSLKDKSMELYCLHPAKGTVYEDENEASLVLQLRYGDFSILMTGDLGENGEQEILGRSEGQKTGSGKNLLETCDILKAGHHGSKESTSEAWLDVLRPKVTLISCGKDNSYGHPHQETLERLKLAGSVVLTAPECGAVTVHSDGNKFRIFTYYTS